MPVPTGVRRPPSLRRLLVGHLALAVAVAAVVSILAVAGIWISARHEARRTAERVWTEVAAGVVARLDDHDFADPAGYDRGDLLAGLAPYLDSGSVYRVKLWLWDGQTARVVLSDEPRIEGARVAMDGEFAARVAGGEIVAHEVPRNAEHRYETAGRGDLLEVFVGFDDAAGNVMLLEAYVPAAIADSVRRDIAVQLPLVLGGVLLVALAGVPLTVALGRRMERDARERTALLQFGLRASDRERRDLAQRLHDGPVQDLASAGIALDLAQGAARRAPAREAEAERLEQVERLEQAGRLVREGISALRTLARDMTPPAGRPADFETALRALVERIAPSSLDVAVAVDPGLDLGEDTAMVLHRAAGELVRNAVRHGTPSRLSISVRRHRSGYASMVIADDGRGFDASGRPGPESLGLRLLQAAATEAGGTFAIESAPGAGTRVEMVLPTSM